MGEYRVSVFSPSGKAHGETTFTVGAAASVIQELVGEHEALGEAANEAADTVDTLIDSLPRVARRRKIKKAWIVQEGAREVEGRNGAIQQALQSCKRPRPSVTGSAPSSIRTSSRRSAIGRSSLAGCAARFASR